jgi:hypothetical protein
VNGAGMESALHAYHSVYGATYRLATKKDPNKGDWLAQSWTVLSECGTFILFDSIEYSGHADEKMVLDFFKKAAEKLLTINPHLQEVWVGASQFARLKLEKYGYVAKPVDKDFRIGGYDKDSYTDAENIVVLMKRTDLKQAQESSVVVHLPEEQKQREEEQKIQYEYELRYGVDTYLQPGKVVKSLGLSKEARKHFNKTYEPVISMLRQDPKNPLLEEGFVSSENDEDTRYREGECYITYEAAKLWLDKVFNSKLKALQLPHHVYAAKETEISRCLEEASQNTSIKTFTLIAFIGIHAVSVFIDHAQGVSFILDSEPGTALDPLIAACKSKFPRIRVIQPEPELRLQRDFYSCTTFALKEGRLYARIAEAFSKLLVNNKTDTLAITDMPAALLKMTQTPLNLTEDQKNTVVSQKRNLTLFEYLKAHKFGDFNTAALKTKLNILRQLAL